MLFRCGSDRLITRATLTNNIFLDKRLQEPVYNHRRRTVPESRKGVLEAIS